MEKAQQMVMTSITSLAGAVIRTAANGAVHGMIEQCQR